MKKRLVIALSVLSLSTVVAFAAPRRAARPPTVVQPWNVPPDPVPVSMPTLEQLEVNGLRVRARTESNIPRVNATLMVRTVPGIPSPTAVSLVMSAALRVGGTLEHSGPGFAPFLARSGLALDVSTTPDYLELTVRTSSDNLPAALALLADLAMKPAYPEAQLELIRQALRMGMRLREGEALTAATDRLMLELFQDHPYASRVEDRELDALTHDLLAKVHARQFAPDRAMLAITSPLEPQALRTAIEAAFGGWKGGAPEEVAIPPMPRDKGAQVEAPVGGAGSAVVAGCNVPLVTELDRVATRVLARALETAVQKKVAALASSHATGARYTSHADGGALWIWAAGPDISFLAGTMGGLLSQFGRGEISDRDVTAATADVMQQVLLELRSMGDMVRASALSELLGRGQAWPARQIEILRTLPADDVRRMGRTLLGGGGVVVVTGGPQGELANVASLNLVPAVVSVAPAAAKGPAAAGEAGEPAPAAKAQAPKTTRKKTRANRRAARDAGAAPKRLPRKAAHPE